MQPPEVAPGTETDRAAAQRRRIAQGALGLWGLLAFVVTGSLASAHEYTLPHPERSDPRLNAALAAQRTPADAGRFSVTHVMYAACSCSQSIIDHLEQRRARKDVAEHVVLVGRDAELSARITRAGYRLDNIEPIALKQRYGIEAAPLLIIADAQGQIAYMGGYTTQKQGLDIRDTVLIDELLAGKHTVELPLLGCAVSRALQSLLDPFGLKYSEEGPG
ncbi:MAG TPA: hypothetical protein VMF89_33205 [Polyangiales bacterium]|nr:hypothetical protein [Polyangiales bacterium]